MVNLVLDLFVVERAVQLPSVVLQVVQDFLGQLVFLSRARGVLLNTAYSSL
jgi:hypothetical protein